MPKTSLSTLTMLLAAIRVLAAALGLGVQIWLVQAYGAAAFGYFSYFLTAVALLCLFAQGGLDTWCLRQVASLQGTGIAWNVLRAILKRNLLIGFAGSIAIGVTYGMTARWLPGSEVSISPYWLAATGFAIVAFRVLLGVVRGLRMALIADSAEHLMRSIMMLLFAWILLQVNLSKIFDSETRAENLIIAYGLSFVLPSLWLLFYLRRNTSKLDSIVSVDMPYKWRTHFSFTGTALLGYIFFQLDTLWLGHYVSPSELGAYNMACNLVRLVIFFPMIVVTLLQPRLAAAIAGHDKLRVRRLVSFALLASGAAAVASALFLLFIGDWVLARIHPDYVVASSSMHWLLLVHGINALLMVWGACLAMSHRYEDTLFAQVPGSLVTVALYAWAIPRWGMPAAPASVLVGMLVCLLVYAVIASRRGGMWNAILLPTT